MTPKERLALDQITRVVESQGWSIIAVDTRGEGVEVTIMKPKAAIDKG